MYDDELYAVYDRDGELIDNNLTYDESLLYSGDESLQIIKV